MLENIHHTYKYTGETYVDQIFFDFYEFFRFNINPIDLRVKGDFTKYPALCIRTVAHIVPPTPKLYMIYTTILFDTTGKIYVIYTVGGAVEPRSEPGIDSYKEYALLVTRDKNAKVEIPEELIGDISVIFIPVSIEIIE